MQELSSGTHGLNEELWEYSAYSSSRSSFIVKLEEKLGELGVLSRIKSLQNLKFLARQGISVRGNNEETESNVCQLLMFTRGR